jgi:tripartite-type tricarboxylate transporter receptor subunit TctC
MINYARVVLLFLFLSGIAHGQTWPAKPVRFIVPNSPGAGPDAISRIAADRFERLLGQPFVVDNRPGGNFMIAAEGILRAAPDGYTIGLGGVTMSGINPNQFKSLSYDPERDFEYIGVLIDTIWGFFGVHPSVPATNFQEFLELVRKNPGKYTYGSTVPSTGMWMQWVMKRSGVELTEVPYKTTAQAIQDSVSGHVPSIIHSFLGFEGFLKQGRMRALISMTEVRHPDYPDLPAIGEIYPGMGFESWIGVVAAKGVPQDMVQRLNRAIDTVVRDPEFNKQTLKLGWSNRLGARTPKELADRAREDKRTWGDIMRAAGVKPQ